jgi:hypothetical protein
MLKGNEAQARYFFERSAESTRVVGKSGKRGWKTLRWRRRIGKAELETINVFREAGLRRP